MSFTAWIASLVQWPLSQAAIMAFLVTSTLFLTLIFLADRLLQRHDASVRGLLWIVAIVMVPLLSVIADKAPATRLNEYVGRVLVSQLPGSAISEQPATAASGAGNQLVVEPNPVLATRKGAVEAALLPLWHWAVIFHCLMMPLLLARIPLGWVRLAQLRRSSFDEKDGRASHLLREVMQAARYRGACEIRLTHQLESPLSFGVLQPIILLPASYYARLSEVELRSLLLHEITHVRHRDALRILVIRVVESFFWFQPLIWLAGRRAQYLTEIAADDAVLETGVNADTYANVIVNLIEIGETPRQELHLAAGIFSAPKMLVARIECLLDRRRAHTTRLGTSKLLAPACAFVVALLASLQLSPRSVAYAADNAALDASIGADWVSIPAGVFLMGATTEQREALYAFGGGKQWLSFIRPQTEASGPVHEVDLDAYEILRYEVTNAQYQKFVNATGHGSMPSAAIPRLNGPRQPVVNVTWNDARAFCEWAGARLPTEAEWEKAARGTTGQTFPWGNVWDASKLQSMDGIARQALPSVEEWQKWRQGNLRTTREARTADVGSFPAGASPYGVMDMAGNVWEWVGDWYDENYYSSSPRKNPQGPAAGDLKVLRGGAWDTPMPVNFSWLRQVFMPPSEGRGVTGFRCARN